MGASLDRRRRPDAVGEHRMSVAAQQVAASAADRGAGGRHHEGVIRRPRHRRGGVLVGRGARRVFVVAGRSASPVTSEAAPPTTAIVDLEEGDPLAFPGFDVDHVTIAPLPELDPDVTEPPLTGWAAFDDEIQRSVLGGGSDAVSVAIAVDGGIVHEAAMGARIPDTFEAVDVEDRFRIASISKTITAITVLQLVEEGLIGLDDPVGTLVAADVGVAPSAGAADITVRQLLTHTSGFAQYEDVFFRHQVESCEQAAGVGLSRGRRRRIVPLQQHELLRAGPSRRAAHG